jgi:hypothetical protein
MQKRFYATKRVSVPALSILVLLSFAMWSGVAVAAVSLI